MLFHWSIWEFVEKKFYKVYNSFVDAIPSKENVNLFSRARVNKYFLFTDKGWQTAQWLGQLSNTRARV